MKNILNGKVLLAALLIAAVLSCGSLVYIFIAKPATSSGAASLNSSMTVIPAPSSTPRPMPPTLTPIPPTPAASPTPAPGQIAPGVYVQPTTGGVGLRVHTDPKLDAPFFSAYDSEVFLVTEGPQQGDNYVWWYLKAPYDANRAGWAVQDFLIAIPPP